MANPISAQSLAARSRQIAEMHLSDAGTLTHPPDVAALDPLAEVLIQEVAARLPAPVRETMLRSQTRSELDKWLAAGAIYPYIAKDATTANQFLRLLDSAVDGAGGAIALARAFALTNEPTLQNSVEFRSKDRQGLILAIGVLLLFLIMRAVGIGFLAAWASGEDISLVGVLDLSNIAALRLLGNPLPGRLLPLFVLALLSAWFALEVNLAPWLAECARRWPARRANMTEPISWRIDSLTVLWMVQALVFLALSQCRFAVFVYYSVCEVDWTIGHILAGCGLAYLLFLTTTAALINLPMVYAFPQKAS